MFDGISGKVIQRMRSRTHQTHFAFKYVPELWQFIEAIAAQKSPDRSDTRIICDLEKRPLPLIPRSQLVFQRVRISNHGAELVAEKRSSLAPGSQCRIVRRPRR